MSVQTIKQGVDPGYKYCGLCPTCGSILEYEYGDLEAPISSYHELHLICPVCGRSLAFNSVPILEEDIEVNDSKLLKFKDTVEVPSGVDVYWLKQFGNEIHLVALTDFIPNDVPILVIGSGTIKFRHFRGVVLEKPQQLVGLSVAAQNPTTGYIINSSLELELKTDVQPGELIIPTTVANESTQIVED